VNFSELRSATSRLLDEPHSRQTVALSKALAGAFHKVIETRCQTSRWAIGQETLGLTPVTSNRSMVIGDFACLGDKKPCALGQSCCWECC
jgi:hypothetical protein